jgi:hypothetical protein
MDGLTGTTLVAKPVTLHYRNTADVKTPCKTFTNKREIVQVMHPIVNNLMHFK